MDINKTFSELAKYKMMEKEICAIIDSLNLAVKEYMTENNLDTLIGDEHKATYQKVHKTSIDRKSLEEEHPRIAKKYTVDSSYMCLRFS